MSSRHETAKTLGRRSFLGLGLSAGIAGAGALTFLPRAVMAKSTANDSRTLGFFNTHTNEILKATYWQNGTYDRAAVDDINYILRDHRSGDVFAMDIKLFDLLTALHRRTDSKKPFEIISGYRSPASNAKLASASNGVAKKSMHMQGKAIDIRLRDVKLADLRLDAMAMKVGGVGFYPKSDFVHVDTGRVRSW
ncbi:DUF882 domain-containing protein [Dongia sp.]|uniref:DUF882 domain-containing protein n=1 Tax=Dongia sp. TaxID=1977262 RepID=UPI0035AF262C